MNKSTAGDRRPNNLPWKVLRGIAAEHRYAPPSNRDPRLREWARGISTRLSRISPKVWQLDVDWRLHSCRLDYLARVPVLKRSVKEEELAHKQIADTLRKAAGYLQRDTQADPLLYGCMEALARHKGDRFGRFHQTRWIVDSKDEPRLAEFLRAIAWMIEGAEVRFAGLHTFATPEFGITLPKVAGQKGAAVEAAARIRAFFLDLTGAPHDSLVNDVIQAYYPDTPVCDWADSASRRKTSKKNQK